MGTYGDWRRKVEAFDLRGLALPRADLAGEVGRDGESGAAAGRLLLLLVGIFARDRRAERYHTESDRLREFPRGDLTFSAPLGLGPGQPAAASCYPP